MIKVANILPCNCIDEAMPRQKCELYLTHKILEHPEKFSFLANDKINNVDSYKILDNSACELGEGMSFDKVLQAAQIIGADEVVLPDLPRSSKSLCNTLKYLADVPQDIPYKLAAVVQGGTEQEVLDCATQILALKRINTIMIPKWYCSLNSSNGLGRHALTYKIIDLMRKYNEPKLIHWLGLDTGMRELITPLAQVVRSVDTGYLAALATPQWAEHNLFFDRPRELKIDLEYMDMNRNRWVQLVQAQTQMLEGEM